MTADREVNDRGLHRVTNGNHNRRGVLPAGGDYRPWSAIGVSEFGFRAAQDQRDYVLGYVRDMERQRRLRREEQRALREAKRRRRQATR
jgi:hypothetical protein